MTLEDHYVTFRSMEMDVFDDNLEYEQYETVKNDLGRKNYRTASEYDYDAYMPYQEAKSSTAAPPTTILPSNFTVSVICVLY